MALKDKELDSFLDEILEGILKSDTPPPAPLSTSGPNSTETSPSTLVGKSINSAAAAAAAAVLKGTRTTTTSTSSNMSTTTSGSTLPPTPPPTVVGGNSSGREKRRVTIAEEGSISSPMETQSSNPTPTTPSTESIGQTLLGKTVIVRNLQSRTELNGESGIVQEDLNNGRVKVYLLRTSSSIAIKYENVTLAPVQCPIPTGVVITGLNTTTTTDTTSSTTVVSEEKASSPVTPITPPSLSKQQTSGTSKKGKNSGNKSSGTTPTHNQTKSTTSSTTSGGNSNTNSFGPNTYRCNDPHLIYSMGPTVRNWTSKTYFYPFGTSSAKLLLTHIPSHVKEIDMLLFACDDLRHILYSVWYMDKSTTSTTSTGAGSAGAGSTSQGSTSTGSTGTGTTTAKPQQLQQQLQSYQQSCQVLNIIAVDQEPTNVARNILLLYLISISSSSIGGSTGSSIGGSTGGRYTFKMIWMIFFSKFIDQTCLEMLITVTGELLSIGEDVHAWHKFPCIGNGGTGMSSMSNTHNGGMVPFAGEAVHFMDQATYTSVREIWQTFHKGSLSSLKEKQMKYIDENRPDYERVSKDAMILTAVMQAQPCVLDAIQNTSMHSKLFHGFNDGKELFSCIYQPEDNIITANTTTNTSASGNSSKLTTTTSSPSSGSNVLSNNVCNIANPMMFRGKEQSLDLHFGLDPTSCFHLALAYTSLQSSGPNFDPKIDTQRKYLYTAPTNIGGGIREGSPYAIAGPNGTNAPSTTYGNGPNGNGGGIPVDKDRILQVCFLEFTEWCNSLKNFLKPLLSTHYLQQCNRYHHCHTTTSTTGSTTALPPYNPSTGYPSNAISNAYTGRSRIRFFFYCGETIDFASYLLNRKYFHQQIIKQRNLMLMKDNNENNKGNYKKNHQTTGKFVIVICLIM